MYLQQYSLLNYHTHIALLSIALHALQNYQPSKQEIYKIPPNIHDHLTISKI